MLSKGDKVPDISLPNQNGEEVKLTSFIGKKPIVVYFYPKDNTTMCTAQACSFRDNYEDFLEAGAEVIGISVDSVESHKKVVEKRKLPFILLSDSKKKALKAFKVPQALFGMISGRSTFVIDKEGIIQNAFKADFSANKHIKESLKTLKKINSE